MEVKNNPTDDMRSIDRSTKKVCIFTKGEGQMITRSKYSGSMTSVMDQASFIRAEAFFTLVLALFVAIGGKISYNWQLNWLLLIGTFVAAIVCIFIFEGSDEPLVSAVGVCGMSLALGLMIGPLAALYPDLVIVEGVVVTAAIMVVMSALGIMFPQIFEGWGIYLMAALTLLIVAQFAQIIFVMMGFAQAANMPLITWAGVAIFTGFVAYDWSKSLSLPYTLDNAIDASGGLILDAVNLLIRLWEIFGSSSSKSSK